MGAGRRVEGGCLGGFGFEAGSAPGRDGRRCFLYSSSPHCSQEARVLVLPLAQKVNLQNFPVTISIAIGSWNSCVTFSGSQLMKVVVPFFFFFFLRNPLGKIKAVANMCQGMVAQTRWGVFSHII